MRDWIRIFGLAVLLAALPTYIYVRAVLLEMKRKRKP